MDKKVKMEKEMDVENICNLLLDLRDDCSVSRRSLSGSEIDGRKINKTRSLDLGDSNTYRKAFGGGGGFSLGKSWTIGWGKRAMTTRAKTGILAGIMVLLIGILSALLLLSEQEFEIRLNEVEESIEFTQEFEYKKFLKNAKELLPDPEDSPYLALALSKNASFIWSNDQHFKKQSLVPVFTTKELVNKLFKGESFS